jgi:DNA-binding NtrC family response regulator
VICVKPSVLLVDHEPLILSSLSLILDDLGFRVHTATDGAAALQIAAEQQPEVVLLDWRMPGMTGEEILQELHKDFGHVPVIILTGVGDSGTAVKALKLGAFDYVNKPVDVEKVQAALFTAVETYRLRVRAMQRYHEEVEQYGFETLVGTSPRFLTVIEAAKRAAAVPNLPVLIEGESGTGKAHLAHAIHLASYAEDRPFVALRVAAYEEERLAELLFGNGENEHGMIGAANGGTLCVDGITALPIPVQERLLTALSEQSRAPKGVRVIGTSRVRLQNAIAAGQFLEELSYRLAAAHLVMPPLRDRREDVPILIEHFLAEFNRRDGRRVGPFTPRALRRLGNHRWQGNVRELRNLVERTFILHGDKEVRVKDLPPDLQTPPEDDFEQILTVHRFVTLRELDRAYCMTVLRHVKENKSAAARLLDVSRQRLRRKLEGVASAEGD